MSEDQLRRIFAEGEPGWLEEPSMRGLDAQKVVDLLDTQTYFELLKRPYPTDRTGFWTGWSRIAWWTLKAEVTQYEDWGDPSGEASRRFLRHRAQSAPRRGLSRYIQVGHEA